MISRRPIPRLVRAYRRMDLQCCFLEDAYQLRWDGEGNAACASGSLTGHCQLDQCARQSAHGLQAAKPRPGHPSV